MLKIILVLTVVFILLTGCQPHIIGHAKGLKKQPLAVRTGIEVLLTDSLHLIAGKRVGLVTNPSGVDSHLRSTADLLFLNPSVKLTALFGPEHGIRGAVYAGDKIDDEIDSQTGLPVFSLYGKTRKPSPEMLNDLDVLVIDIQDIGVRAYTYIYTMAMVMEAAAEADLPVLVLDRPNPLGGIKLEGNLVEAGFESFVGMYPIPYRHGMTIGELARYFNAEYEINCQLTVIPLKNWQRSMLWDQTGLPWIPPSPHVPHWQTVLFMSTTGTIGELRTVSEGVGYTSPFELIGAPWIDGRQLADSLNALRLPGIRFRPLDYRPYYGPFAGQTLQGVQLHIINSHTFQSYESGIYIMAELLRLYPEHNIFENDRRLSMFHKVMGCEWITEDLKHGVPVAEIVQKWQQDLDAFKIIRKEYLLYQ